LAAKGPHRAVGRRTVAPGTGGDWIELRAARYTYYRMGHAAAITVKDTYVDENTTAGDCDDHTWYNSLALYYGLDGASWRALTTPAG
jgi:hypothetical protein